MSPGRTEATQQNTFLKQSITYILICTKTELLKKRKEKENHIKYLASHLLAARSSTAELCK